ncbi:hypothetical protein [Halomonas sp. I5-271120]|uniref:hypothetical protein n=1 Tax=Halomonas sp. I5-271120 TaxID=3061632 RepID=UPI0027145B23|nr:hypothetical protein [Halomonas sp. I5-271120]
MKSIVEKRIEKYQWATFLVGMILLASALVLTWTLDPRGIFSAVGAMGWFALCLMMSPRVRGDLFGDRFEADQTDSDS